jgi:hypothetical protein
MSTLESEYIARSQGSPEAKWLPQLHRDRHGKDTSLLPIKCVIQGALCHFTAGIIKACIKHIDVCDHDSQDLQPRKIVDCFHMHTNEKMADKPNKALRKDKHK